MLLFYMALEQKTDLFKSVRDIEEKIKKDRGTIIYKSAAFSIPSCGEECSDALWRMTNLYKNRGITTEFYSCEGCKHPATVSFSIKYKKN